MTTIEHLNAELQRLAAGKSYAFQRAEILRNGAADLRIKLGKVAEALTDAQAKHAAGQLSIEHVKPLEIESGRLAAEATAKEIEVARLQAQAEEMQAEHNRIQAQLRGV